MRERVRNALAALVLTSLSLCPVAAEQAQEFDKEAGTRKFQTEPEFYPETFNITHFSTPLRPSAEPRYIFIAPLAKFFDWGPQIYDLEGSLVFYGDVVPGIQKHVEDFKVCDYLGEQGNHLCLHDGDKRGTIGGINPVGRKVYLDNTYTQVGLNYTYPDQHNHTYPNSHEFQSVDNGYRFLEPVYRPINTDLRPYLGTQDAWLWDACFYEIDVGTGQETFQWCYLDHYPVWETNLFLEADGSPNVTSPKAGGGNFGWPWDPLHLNALDKNSEGDYLVSIRHLDQILKIAGNDNRRGLQPGETIWRLGGKSNDFDLGSLTFSKQHSVRFVSLTGEEETFGIFDNAWEGTNTPSAKVSAGKIVVVNNATMTARSLIEYPHPAGRMSESQGNMQILPDSNNIVVGWGFLPEMTEFTTNGTALWHASFSKDDQRPAFSYRTFVSPWVGRPKWEPKLIAYASSCKMSRKEPMVAYVSHNGATEIRQWRFYTASSSRGPWLPAGTFLKRGFETKVVLSRARLTRTLSPFMPYVMVEALDAYGAVLNRVNTTTFVPDRKAIATMRKCNAHGCPIGFDYASEFSRSSECKTSSLPTVLPLAFVVIVMEFLAYIAGFTIRNVADRSRLGPSSVVTGREGLNGSRLDGVLGPPRQGKKVGRHQA